MGLCAIHLILKGSAYDIYLWYAFEITCLKLLTHHPVGNKWNHSSKMDPIDICWMDHPKLYPMPMSHQDLIIAIAYSMVYQTNYHKTPKCKKHTGTIGH